MIISATCTTILAALAAATGGETIALSGNCGTLKITKAYATPITIDAEKAQVATLQISGSNVRWTGGRLVARDGLNGFGIYGYAAYVTGSNVSFDRVVFTGAKYGIVASGPRMLRVTNSRFTGLRADGIQVQLTDGFLVANSVFEKSQPLPRTCTLADGTVQTGVAPANCKGVWKDGDHADAVQMRNGVSNAWLIRNIVSGNTQGLTQMGATTDKPLSKVRISQNKVAVDQPHPITLQSCKDCAIDGNFVYRTPAMPWKVQILPGTAFRCGNQVQDDKIQDGPCTVTLPLPMIR